MTGKTTARSRWLEIIRAEDVYERMNVAVSFIKEAAGTKVFAITASDQVHEECRKHLRDAWVLYPQLTTRAGTEMPSIRSALNRKADLILLDHTEPVSQEVAGMIADAAITGHRIILIMEASSEAECRQKTAELFGNEDIRYLLDQEAQHA